VEIALLENKRLPGFIERPKIPLNTCHVTHTNLNVKFACELKSAVGIVFPEVSAIAQPVIVVMTALDWLSGFQDALCHFVVEAMIAKHEDC
jgi:hypothetical protein